MQTYKDWLKVYFSKISDLPENVEKENYFEVGIIDSVEVIFLIEAMEKKFGIKFTEKHFQDRRFSTIEGLSEIIAELKGE